MFGSLASRKQLRMALHCIQERLRHNARPRQGDSMRPTINGMIRWGLDLMKIGSARRDVADIDWSVASPPAGLNFPENDPVSAIYSFTIRGIRLDVPRSILQPDVWHSLVHGYYEGSEIDSLLYAIRPGDRILEIGAGIGFISSFAVRELRAAHLIVVEAEPRLIPVIRRTHELNGVTADVRNAAVTATGGTVEFNRQPSFWASSLLDLPGGTMVRLPAQRLQALVEEAEPDVLIVDVEGGEGQLFEGFQPPPRLRHAVVEVHKPQAGLTGIAACFAAMAGAAMAYDPDGSSRTNVTFSRT
jgi:FkbM family methyltransferase